MFAEKPIENKKLIEPLLSSLGLGNLGFVDYTVGIFDNQKLIATGSIFKGIIKGVAIHSDYQGQGILSQVITHLITMGSQLGYQEFFLFTTAKEAVHFKHLGFNEIASCENQVVFLEWSGRGIRAFRDKLRALSNHNPTEASCIVLNANPFTLGHRYLIEQALLDSHWLYLLVVEEDCSAFSFKDRMYLVEQGVIDLPRISVIPSSRYVISKLTFPSYFLSSEQKEHIHACIDLEIFGNYIAPALKVTRRFVGTEPNSLITDLYNKEMQLLLPKKGVEIIEVPRLVIDETVVSASHVRELIALNKMRELKRLVPESTYEWLQSDNAQYALKQLQHKRL